MGRPATYFAPALLAAASIALAACVENLHYSPNETGPAMTIPGFEQPGTTERNTDG